MHLKQVFILSILMLLISCCPAENTSESGSDAKKPEPATNETKYSKLFGSLSEGQKEAAKTNKQQLLILTNELTEDHKKYIKKLLNDKVFIEISNTSVVPIKINFPLKKDASDEEFKAVSEFVKKYGITKKPLQFVLINVKNSEEVLRIVPDLKDPKDLLREIVPILPEKYKGQWITNFEAAKMIAGKTGRYVLVNFTGSDWCIWCKRLKEEIFDKGGFRKYAKENLVLVEIDFPRRKPLPEAQQKKNSKLAEKYEVRGYPTVIILKPDGEFAGRTGYVRGGEKEFIKGLKQITGK